MTFSTICPLHFTLKYASKPEYYCTATHGGAEQLDPPTTVSNAPQLSKCDQLTLHERVPLVELRSIGWSYAQLQKQYPHFQLARSGLQLDDHLCTALVKRLFLDQGLKNLPMMRNHTCFKQLQRASA